MVVSFECDSTAGGEAFRFKWWDLMATGGWFHGSAYAG